MEPILKPEELEGRELRATVAVEIFGWERWNEEGHAGAWAMYLRPPGGIVGDEIHEDNWERVLPPWDSNVMQAMDVVAKVRERFPAEVRERFPGPVELSRVIGGGWKARFFACEPAFGATEPEAICRAALAAVRAER